MTKDELKQIIKESISEINIESSIIVDESAPLETLLTTNPFEKELTLYHGSYLKLDIINPTSFNAGTKLSKNRLSSFWATNYNEARMFAFFRLSESVGIMILFNENMDGFFIRPCDKDKLELLYDKKLYIYKKTLSKDYIGIGHSRYGEEYTVDLPVKPDEVHIEKYVNFKNLINNIEYFPSDDEKEISIFYKPILNKIVNKRISLRRSLITRSFDDFKKIKKKAKNELLK